MSRTWSLRPRHIFTTGALVAALLSAAARPTAASAQTLPASSLPNPSVALRIGQADGVRSGADYDEFQGGGSRSIEGLSPRGGWPLAARGWGGLGGER